MRDGARTRARIEEEALRLFAAQGIEATSIRDIATAVGVAEGALYRHFPSKDSLARTLFQNAYANLAGRVLAVAGEGMGVDDSVRRVVELFCALFDENRPLFSFLLISQHAFLSDVSRLPHRNVVEAVKSLFQEAIAKGEIPPQDPDEVAALALGIVAQPAIFALYGRLQGSMAGRASRLADAVMAAARSG
jgi:AcrR family transcriptional regulator